LASFVLFQPFLANLFNGQNAPGADVIKLMLSNTVPMITWGTFAQVPEIPAGAGYSAGGFPLTVVSSTQTGGVYTLVLQDTTLIATGIMAPWRWAIIYDAAKNTLIGYADNGVVISLDAGELVNFHFDPISGLIQAFPS
jgi:hypothetical protein